MTQPNILLIHSDQHRFDALGCNGHSVVQTPNLDRLAAEGVNYTNAFTPTPICTPARGSLITGAWPTAHGATNITGAETYRPMRDDFITVFELLKQADYDIRYVGKFHEETEKAPDSYGVDEFIPAGEYWSWREKQGCNPPPGRNGWFGDVDDEITADQSRLAWGADTAKRMMEDASKGDKPFFVRWDPPEPHLPNNVPEPYHSMYPSDQVPPWPSSGDPMESKPYVQWLQQKRWGVEDWSWQEWAPAVSRYLGDISLLDAQVGKLLDALDEFGVAENTLVIYTTDHGDFCGGHGLMDKHFAGYDDIMRVPLIMRWPGKLPQAYECDVFSVHEIDVATTLCKAADVEPPEEQFRGCDLVGAANGTVHVPREDIFSMYQGCQMGLWSLRMVRDTRYKFIYHATDKPELYDLQNDPGELDNRADDPAYSEEVKRLRERTIAWMEDISDPLLNQWTRYQLSRGIW